MEKTLLAAFFIGLVLTIGSLGYLGFILFEAKKKGIPKSEISERFNAKSAFYIMISCASFTLLVAIAMGFVQKDGG